MIEEKYDVIVLDSLRRGCDLEFLNKILDNAPQKIIYVSCDPAILDSDVKFITEDGYKVGTIKTVDMFPYTSYIETILLLNRII